MKGLFAVCVCFLGLVSHAQEKESFNEDQLYLELRVLAQKKNFFEVKELVLANKSRIDKEVYFYYWSLVENAFSHFRESNEAIEAFMEGAGSMSNDSLFKEILLVKQLNLVNLFEYKDASLTNDYILEHFGHVCTEKELADFVNTGKIWKALEHSGKQQIHRSADTHIQLVRDKAKLANIPVTISGHTKDFVFDTGANFSVIQRSVALEMKCEIIPVQFEVGAITGATVKSDLAVVKELYLGDMRCENVVFLVLDDTDLSFPSANYFIRGIIGFPVIRALEEIHLNKKDQLFIPKTAQQYPQSNMLLDGLMPVVQVTQGADTLQFTFDTGAVTTSLNQGYYEKYRDVVDRKGEKQTLRVGGAGGMVESEGIVLPKITLAVGDSKATIRKVQVRTGKSEETDSYFTGNLGQDFIKQFDEMIISFKYSAIQFNN